MTSPIRIVGLTLRYLSPVLVIAVGAFAAQRLIASRQLPPKSERPPRVLPVDVVDVSLERHTTTLEAFGSVEPLRTLTVRPYVAGPIVALHPALVVGGRIPAGEAILEIDPRDFELAVRTAEAAVEAAEADLEVERGNAAVAAKEWELLSKSFESNEDSKSLALREPFLRRRESDVSSARARLDQARLDLERTRILAPFDALVTAESVEVGTTVNLGADLATLVDTAVFSIEVSVPQARLAGLEGPGSAAAVHLADGAPARAGRFAGLLGEVDRAGRMARLRVEVARPLDVEGAEPAALLGSYARVELPLVPLEGAAAIPRTALREGDVVWLVNAEQQLEIRPVDVGLRRDGDVLVTSGLRDGELVISSPISVPVPGMRVRPTGDAGSAPDAGEPGESGQ